MSRSLLIGIFITLIVFSGIATLFYVNYVKVKSRPLHEAIPNSSAMYIETSNVSQAWAVIYNSSMWKSLVQNAEARRFSEQIVYLDSLFQQYSELSALTQQSRCAFSIHVLNGSPELFVAVEKKESVEWIKILTELVQSTRHKMLMRQFEKVRVYDITQPSGVPVMSVAVIDNFLIVSTSGLLIEESIRKIKYKLNGEWNGIESLAAMASAGSTFNWYIQYSHIGDYLGYYLNDTNRDAAQLMRKLAKWSMLDVTVDKHAVQMTGLTITHDSLYQFLDLFKNQQPVKLDVLHPYIPSNTAWMIRLGFSNYPLFRTDLQEYIQHSASYSGYQFYTDSIEKLYGFETDDLIGTLGNQAVLGSLSGLSSEPASQVFAVVQLKDPVLFEKTMKTYLKQIQNRLVTDSIGGASEYEGYTLYKLTIGPMFKLYFGELFEIMESPYFTKVNDVMYAANSKEVLQQLIDAYRSGHHIEDNETFRQIQNQSASVANLSFYVNTSYTYSQLGNLVSRDFYSTLSRFNQDFKKFAAIHLQFASTNEQTFYTRFDLFYDREFTESTREIWTIPLDTAPATLPFYVFNDSMQQYDVLIQDKHLNLYYITNAGALKWKVKMTSEIKGEIHSVLHPILKQYVYVFNTEKNMVMMDRSGRNMAGFPVALPGKAETSISVFDVYGDSNYTFYLPLSNNRIVGYDMQGKVLKGWNPKTVSKKLTTSLRLTGTGTIKYIYGTDEYGKLYVYSPQGVEVKHAIPPTDTGKVHLIRVSSDALGFTVLGSDSAGVFVRFLVNNNWEIQDMKTLNIPLSVNRVIPLGDTYAVYSDSNVLYTVEMESGAVTSTRLGNVLMYPIWTSRLSDGNAVVCSIQLPGEGHGMTASGVNPFSFIPPTKYRFNVYGILNDGVNYLTVIEGNNILKLYRLK